MESDNATGAALRAPEARTEALRASLTTRLDAETLLAEAGEARRAAVMGADGILAEAQQVASQLVADTRSRIERDSARAQSEAQEVIARARADSDALRAKAEADVEEHRRRVRAEVTAQVEREVLDRARAEMAVMREQSAAMIGDLEASVRILGVALETAQTNVGEMLGALGDLRTHTVESWAGDTADLGSAPMTVVVEDEPVDELEDEFEDEFEDDVDADDELETELGGDPIGGDPIGGELEGESDEGSRPRTALEAYLRSAHLDHGDPPLPAVDDTQVGIRYVQDARRGRPMSVVRADDEPAAESESDLEDERADDQPDSDEDRAKPLGWLFRSAP